MKIAGFDIGGANTDLAIVEYENGEIKDIQTVFEYLPMWSQNERLGNVLYDLIEKICPVDEIDAVGISMTAELVDAFETKAQGVLDIATTCEKLFDCPVAYIGTDKVLSLAELIANPIEVAAANWIATSHIVAEIEKTNEFVYWKRIGTVNHSIERLEERKEHGIVFVDSYSDDDWIKYRDAAFMRVDSYEWKEWTSTHWSEELFRRHINYTYKCYQDDRNIDWIYTCNWCFDRKQYDSLVSECVPKWCMGNDE